MRGCSSAGRAPALQAGGQEFDPPHLHHGRSKMQEARKVIAESVKHCKKRDKVRIRTKTPKRIAKAF